MWSAINYLKENIVKVEEVQLEYMQNDIRLNPRLTGIKKAASVKVGQLIDEQT